LIQSAVRSSASNWRRSSKVAIWGPYWDDFNRDPAQTQVSRIYLEYDAAFDWPADNPRLDTLAERSERRFVKRGGGLTTGKQPVPDPGIVQLIATSTGS
jgi:hypothetical protein